MLTLVAVLGLASCSTDYTGVAVPTGEWGGTNAGLEVSETGATALFKCGAQGAIAEPLRLDATAHFQASGTYEPRLVQTGPRPATYLGLVSGDHLVLTVRLDGESLGPFELLAHQQPQFDPCNF
jgi:hypothetical protein